MSPRDVRRSTDTSPAFGEDRDVSATAARTPAGGAGRGEQRMIPRQRPRSYYGRPVIKEPVWTWEIPVYFFTGGLAGASAALAFGARVVGNAELARRAWLTALGAVTVSPVLLIADLGRPARFLNMLRVFKLSSPMNLGSWLLTASATTVAAATAHETLGVLPRPAGRAVGAAAAVFGLPLSTYTAGLLADTAVPIWHEARRELPLVFGGSAMVSAGAVGAIVTPVQNAGPARRLTLAGALLEGGASQAMDRRLGELAEPYHSATCGRLSRLAKGLTTAGAFTTVVGGRRSRLLAVAGGCAALAGALLERWAIFRAGFQSARDPKYTVGPQRERAAARRGSAG